MCAWVLFPQVYLQESCADLGQAPLLSSNNYQMSLNYHMQGVYNHHKRVVVIFDRLKANILSATTTLKMDRRGSQRDIPLPEQYFGAELELVHE